VKNSKEVKTSKEAQTSADDKVSGDGHVVSYMSRFKDIWLSLSGFHLIFIPVIFLTLLFVILVAAYSPFNAATHYLVDSTKDGGLNGYGSGYHGRLIVKVNPITKRVLEGIEKVQEEVKLRK